MVRGQETANDYWSLTMNNLSRTTGQEGPKHDPYAFTEITFVKSNGDEVVIHEGLGTWVKLNGQSQTPDSYIVNEYHKNGRDPSGLYKQLFEKLSGLSVKQAERILDRRNRPPTKCTACGSKHIDEVAGYPGEYFLMCKDCGQVLDSRFNLSEVE